MQRFGTVQSFSKTMAVLAAILLSVALAHAGSFYPDINVEYSSENHLIVHYGPILSGNLTALGHGELIPTVDGDVWGRSFVVALPATGDFSFSFTCRPGVSGIIADGRQYIGAAAPLVRHGNVYEARGRRLVRFAVFPQRVENGRLATYTDFAIDITFAAEAAEPTAAARRSRLDSILASTVVNPQQFLHFAPQHRAMPAAKRAPAVFSPEAVWVKVSVGESGVTRISGSALAQAGISLTNLRSDSLRMFYAGGRTLPDDASVPDPEFHQISIRVEDGDDGRFDAADAVFFYAEGPKRYKFDTGRPVYVANPYDRTNVYWLAIGGYAAASPLRWNLENSTPGAFDQAVTVTRQPLRVEQNHLLKTDIDGRIRDYFTWYWSDQNTVATTINLPSLALGDSIAIEMAAICDFYGTTVQMNGVSMNRTYSGGGTAHFWNKTGAAVAGLNTIQILLRGSGTTAPYLDYLNVSYPMRPAYRDRQIEFNSAGYSGRLRFDVTGYTASHLTLDITAPDYPVLVSGVEITGDTARFQRAATAEQPVRLVVFARSAMSAPVALEEIALGQLRGDLSQYDGVVIAPRSLLASLAEYQAYRQASSGRKVKLVAVEDVYNEFGYGLLSPQAIRNYLKYVYENYAEPAPYAALLVGDGHYDFLDNTGLHAPSYIPPFIWSRENSVGDDNFAYFGRVDRLDSDSSYIKVPDRGWDIMIARWPVQSTNDVAAYMAKIRNYESPSTQGEWRSRVTYVADDEFKGSFSGEIIHTAQSETLAVRHTPEAFNRQKIYATDYAFASSGEKPAVNDAIIRAVNEGTLVVNYIGHGSPDVWADEHILKKSGDLARMQNSDKLTVVIAASCSIGMFDAPDREGMAELLFRQPGGAVATVSATRLVYATDNSVFNYDLYDALFNGDHNVSEAAFAVKVMHQYDRPYDISLLRNDRSYVVFGDVLSDLGMPRYRLEITPVAESVLVPLQEFRYTGRVVDEEGQSVAVDGTLDISVFDSPSIRNHALGLTYSLTGPTIFRGTVAAAAGVFEGGFIVPLDIDYGGRDSRISGYGAFEGVSGLGGLDSLRVADSAAGTADNSGPIITCSFTESPKFMSGDRIPANATLVAALSDSSGINLTGGLGHRIELVVDNDNNTTLNLTNRFAYRPNDFRAGELRIAMPDLAPGRHSFKVTAWDNANNPAVGEFEAMVMEAGDLVIVDVMNYPNPMEETTEFFFELSQAAEEVELQIFTLSGLQIKRFTGPDPISGRNRMFLWDGRDDDGDRVAQGVYIYKLTARGRVSAGATSADNKAEAFGKLIILN